MHKNTYKKAHITLLKTELIFIIAALAMAAFVFGFFSDRLRGGPELKRETIAPPVQTVPALSSSPSTSSKSESKSSEKRINLNTAGLEELNSLPEIGAVLAERILSYREANGGFKRVEEIMHVNGIGEKTFEKIKNQIYVG